MGYWDIYEEFGILGYWPRGNWDIGPLKMGYWDIDPLKLGYWDIGPLKLGYLGYRDPLYHPPINPQSSYKILATLTFSFGAEKTQTTL